VFLLPYQLEYFNYDGNLIYEKSRQIGITWACAFKTITRSMSKDQHTHYVAQDMKSSRRFIAECTELLKLLAVPTSLYEATAEKIIFANGSSIYGLTSNPKTLRGRKGVVVLDEFAFHENQKALLAAAQPVVTWGGWIEIISTHNGPFTDYNLMITDARSGKNTYKVFKTDIYQAIAGGIVEKINEGKKDKQTNEEFLANLKDNTSGFTFAQEYECKIADESSYIVSQELYHKLCKDIPSELHGEYSDLYIGIDIGRSRNWTVIWVLQKTIIENSPFYETVAVRVLKDMRLQDQIDIIDGYISHPGVNKVNIDKGLFGLSIFEHFDSKFGFLINGIQITRPYQKGLCEKVRRAVEFEQVSLPKDDQIMADICSMAQVYKNASVSYGGGVGDSHADAFYGLGLALDAAHTPEICIAVA
jgi:phage FluMu gp28-like protein